MGILSLGTSGSGSFLSKANAFTVKKIQLYDHFAITSLSMGLACLVFVHFGEVHSCPLTPMAGPWRGIVASKPHTVLALVLLGAIAIST
jgi:hypothetical protein